MISTPLSHPADGAATWSTTSPAMPLVPTTRIVPSLETALVEIRRSGGSVTSETRSVAGIGSWAFVADGARLEVVLWEHAH